MNAYRVRMREKSLKRDRSLPLILMKQPFMRMDRRRKLISLSVEPEQILFIIETD